MQHPAADRAQHVGRRAPEPRRRGSRAAPGWARAPTPRRRAARAARRSASSPKTSGSRPAVVLASETAPVCSSRSTKTPARKPGIDPPWPTSVRPSTRSTCRPSPYADQPGAEGSTPAGTVISSSVAGSSTSPVSPSRKAPNRAEVGQRRPQLPGGGHHAGVVLRLGQDDVGPRVHGAPLRRGPHRAGRRPVHAERREHLGGDGVLPRRAAQPRDQLAEQAEAEVGVVEPPGGAEDDVVRRRGPRSASEPPGTRSHQPPGLSAEAPARCESSWPTVRSPSGVPGRCRSSGSSRCSRPSSRSRITSDGGDGLADRPEPVLDVGVRLGDRRRARPTRPARRRGRRRRPGSAPGPRAARGRCAPGGRGRWSAGRVPA